LLPTLATKNRTSHERNRLSYQNQATKSNQKRKNFHDYLFVNLSHHTCGDSTVFLVSTAITLRFWQTPLGLGQRTAVGIPINAVAL
jgi:hypothetical protein